MVLYSLVLYNNPNEVLTLLFLSKKYALNKKNFYILKIYASNYDLKVEKHVIRRIKSMWRKYKMKGVKWREASCTKRGKDKEKF